MADFASRYPLVESRSIVAQVRKGRRGRRSHVPPALSDLTTAISSPPGSPKGNVPTTSGAVVVDTRSHGNEMEVSGGSDRETDDNMSDHVSDTSQSSDSEYDDLEAVTDNQPAPEWGTPHVIGKSSTMETMSEDETGEGANTQSESPQGTRKTSAEDSFEYSVSDELITGQRTILQELAKLCGAARAATEKPAWFTAIKDPQYKVFDGLEVVVAGTPGT